MSTSHHQIYDASLGMAMVQKWLIVGKAWQFFDVFIVVDRSVTQVWQGKKAVLALLLAT